MSLVPPRRVHAVALCLVLAALAVHFGMTLLYLTPPTPLRQEVGGVADRYMTPWFEQRWELFAEAVKNSRHLLIACRSAGDPPGREPAWHDLTRPLLDAKHATRITPADRLHRAVQAATALVFREADPLVDKMRAEAERFETELARVDRRIARRFAIGQRVITRLGSAHCDRLLGPGRTVAVRGRVIVAEPPPFSKRLEDDRQGTARVIDFDWQDHQPVARL